MKRNLPPKYTYFLFLAGILAALCQTPAQAALFDAAEFLRPGGFALGLNGDLLLNDPSGEAVEARVKGGVNQMVNLQGIIATGNKNRRFKFGRLSNINFFPDIPGQFGVTVLAGGAYVKRYYYNGLQILVGPMLHHNFGDLDGKPVNVFLAVPMTLELHDGTYTTGSQIAFGGLYDIDSHQNWFLSAEAAISLRRSESYISAGVGYRLGTGNEPRIQRRRSREPEDSYEEQNRQGRNRPGGSSTINPDGSVRTIESGEESE